LVLEEQFPSNVYPWRALAERDGGAVTTIARPRDRSWTEAIGADLSEDVAVVALPNFHWTDGSFIDLEVLAPRIKDIGAILLLDLSQSLGVVPPNLEKIAPDYIVSVGYKWLLGPYRCTYFYVAPHRQDQPPLEHAWSGRFGSQDSSNLTNYSDDFMPGARRFDSGERGDYITIPMAQAGLKQVARWGQKDIAATLRPLTARLAEGARELSLDTLAPELRAPHFLGFRFENKPESALVKALEAEGVYVSIRGKTLRVSPYLYNDGEDIERFLGALERLIRQKAFAIR
ncbi:MAG: aminotransferase class V-fold PLP-dependent enzyme, partial [Kiloniellales bacterium]|nr:aminotransferase class V-fold PLP-dependent enzyme [Kiloniellales bacterium]